MREAAYREHFEVEDRHWWFRGRWAVIEALLARTALPASPRILDAGCGTGLNLRRYGAYGRAEGFDPSPEAVRFCAERGLDGVTQAAMEDLPYKDGSFDLIAATDVVEHVADDVLALRELHRVAAPGAALLLTVPAYSWLWSEEDERLHHYRRYTRPQLRRAIETAGWKTEIATYFNSLLLPPIAIARQLPKRGGEVAEVERTPAWLDAPLSWPMRLEARLIRAGVSFPAGVSVGIVGRRRD